MATLNLGCWAGADIRVQRQNMMKCYLRTFSIRVLGVRVKVWYRAPPYIFWDYKGDLL